MKDLLIVLGVVTLSAMSGWAACWAFRPADSFWRGYCQAIDDEGICSRVDNLERTVFGADRPSTHASIHDLKGRIQALEIQVASDPELFPEPTSPEICQ